MNNNAEEANNTNNNNIKKSLNKEKRQTKMISVATASRISSVVESNSTKASSSATGAKSRGRPRKEKNLPEATEETKARAYNRSKVPTFRWSQQLHDSFVHAVQNLGGVDRASPKMVLDAMNVDSLTIAHVKSHLQMYRKYKKREQAGQVKRRYYRKTDFPSPSFSSTLNPRYGKNTQNQSNKTDDNADEEEPAGIQAQGNHPEQSRNGYRGGAESTNNVGNGDEKKEPTFIFFKELLGGPSTHENNNNPPQVESLGAAYYQILQKKAVVAAEEKTDDEDMLSLTIGSRIPPVLNNQNAMADVSLELKLV
ncbi:hypothetical protein RIF29_40727 [Crotalaria pallida]|uniref:Myb-like domain-containing protein n=1 Tax=Crotalaria pallida TaxID=3830 RepID=A0AAN9E6N6_CROPI